MTVTARMRFLKYNPIILPKKLQQLLRWPLSKDVVDDQCRGIRVYSKDTSNLFDNKFDHQASTKRERGSSLSPSFSPSDKLTDDDNLS